MIKLADGRGSLFQWDTGRQVECDAEQVHFSNHHYGTSIDVDVQDGKATIPNQLLTSATPIKAWAWVKDSNGEYTKEEQIFIVAKRNKPSNYVYTPTEIKTWQDLQNQIGDLNNLTTAHKDNLVNAINDAAESGGTSDFIIKMTVESNNDGYTVTSCDATFEQVEAAVADEKSVILVASFGGEIYELPMIQYVQGSGYRFGTFFMGMVIYSTVYKTENANSWSFVMTVIGAYAVDYSNTALPNISTVEDALNELVPKSHSHDNKDTLDKLSDSNGKLQYNGSDVGLKGDKGADGKDGITPTIGDNGNWYIGSTDTGKPSRGVAGARGDKGDAGADGADGKSAYQYAQEGGYTGTETEFAEKLASGALIVTITDNNGTLSADKTYIEIRDAIRAGRPAFVSWDGIELPFYMGDNALLLGEGSLFFGNSGCTLGDTKTFVDMTTVEITPNDEVNFSLDTVETLPNPHAITFTGAVTGSYDGSSPMSVNIPSAVTDDHINSLIDTKLGVIENGSY